MLSVKSAINKSYNKTRPANILSIYNDGIFDCTLAETGHNFFGIADQSCYQWNHLTDCHPENIHLCNKDELYAQNFDFILANDRIRNAELIKKYMEYFSIPAVIIDHVKSPKNRYISKNIVPSYCQTVADTLEIKNSFMSSILIEPYFETVKKKKDIDFVIMGDFLKQDEKIIDNIMTTSNNSIFVGTLDVRNKVAPKNYDEYIDIIHRAKVYVLLNAKPGLCYNALRSLFSDGIVCMTHNDTMENFLSSKLDAGYEFIYIVSEISKIIDNIKKSIDAYDTHYKLWNKQEYSYKALFDRMTNEVLIR